MQKYTSQTSKWVNSVTLFLTGLIRAGNIQEDYMLPIIFNSLGRTASNTVCPPRKADYIFNQCHPTIT